MGPLLNAAGNLLTQEMGKTMYLVLFLLQFLRVRLALRNPRPQRPVGKSRERKTYFSGEGSGYGAFKQIGHTQVHGPCSDAPTSAEGVG